MQLVESGNAFWVSRCNESVPTVSTVSITLFRRRRSVEPAGPTERPEVRQYRYLLRTVDLEVLEVLHREALGALDPLIRGHILRTAQDRLLSGREITVDDVAALSHLVVVGEGRIPGILVSALTDSALERLAHFVVQRPSSAALLVGYDAWDDGDTGSPEVADRAAPPRGPSSSPATAAQVKRIASQGA